MARQKQRAVGIHLSCKFERTGDFESIVDLYTTAFSEAVQELVSIFSPEVWRLGPVPEAEAEGRVSRMWTPKGETSACGIYTQRGKERDLGEVQEDSLSSLLRPDNSVHPKKNWLQATPTTKRDANFLPSY